MFTDSRQINRVILQIHPHSMRMTDGVLVKGQGEFTWTTMQTFVSDDGLSIQVLILVSQGDMQISQNQEI
jgi:hypothetical protein